MGDFGRALKLPSKMGTDNLVSLKKRRRNITSKVDVSKRSSMNRLTVRKLV